MNRLGLVGLLGAMTACTPDPGLPEATEGTASTETTVATDAESTVAGTDTSTTSTLEPTDTGNTADTGDTDPADTESTDDGMEHPDCEPRDESVVAQFSITVDGTPIVVDYSTFHAEVSGLPDSWWELDSATKINGGPCQVTAFAADQGLISMICDDAMGVSRTIELTFSSFPLLAPVIEGDEVQLHYNIQSANDMLEHEPDTAAHAFVLRADTEILLAGIDGRYSVDSSLGDAWPPSVLRCELLQGDCVPHDRDLAWVRRLPDEEGTTLDGGFVPVGELLVVVETASIDDADREPAEAIDKETVRLLVGPPA